MLYRMFVPPQAVGANKVYWDLFNATTSPGCLEVVSLVPVVSGAVAVTGALAVDLYLTRTTSVGTGGTAATLEGSALDALTITAAGTGRPLTGRAITARRAPGGGAAAGAVIAFRSLFPEETNAGTYMAQLMNFAEPSIHVPRGTGLRVVQGSVASVGNVGFDVAFRVGP